MNVATSSVPQDLSDYLSVENNLLLKSKVEVVYNVASSTGSTTISQILFSTEYDPTLFFLLTGGILIYLVNLIIKRFRK